MEFKARYQLIGVFTLAVIIAAFAFIYWLSNKGFGPRVTYRVDFSEPVSGLSIGGPVLFNGVRVGEVTAINLDRERPGHLLVDISVGMITPIKKDTLVGVDYQGLTGAASILLSGGSAGADLHMPKNGQPILLRADPDASRSWTRSAGRLLSSLEKWIGNNSSRLDGILAGLERMTGGGGKSEIPIYDLPAATGFNPGGRELPGQLVIAEPAISLALNTDKLQKALPGAKMLTIANGHWADNLPNLAQARIIQSFENAGHINKVLRPDEAMDPPFKLLLDIRQFALAEDGARKQATIGFTAKLIDGSGKILAARPFNGSAPASSAKAEDAARALGELFARLERELVEWTVKTMPKKAPANSAETDEELPASSDIQ